MNKYEDYLRSLFGKQAYLLFTIDKILASTCKALSGLISDELAKKILFYFINPSDYKR